MLQTVLDGIEPMFHDNLPKQNVSNDGIKLTTSNWLFAQNVWKTIEEEEEEASEQILWIGFLLIETKEKPGHLQSKRHCTQFSAIFLPQDIWDVSELSWISKCWFQKSSHKSGSKALQMKFVNKIQRQVQTQIACLCCMAFCVSKESSIFHQNQQFDWAQPPQIFKVGLWWNWPNPSNILWFPHGKFQCGQLFWVSSQCGWWAHKRTKKRQKRAWHALSPWLRLFVTSKCFLTCKLRDKSEALRQNWTPFQWDVLKKGLLLWITLIISGAITIEKEIYWWTILERCINYVFTIQVQCCVPPSCPSTRSLRDFRPRIQRPNSAQTCLGQ